MTELIRSRFILGAVLALCITATILLLLYGISSPRDLQTVTHQEGAIFVWERQRDYLGGGYALHPTENRLLYIGQDNGIYMKDLGTGEATLLLKEADGLDVFEILSFSNDGSKILFIASGGTTAYPSNIYVLEVNTSKIKRLTKTEFVGERSQGSMIYYDKVFTFAEFSSDDKRILFGFDDHTLSVSLLGIMNADGSGMTVLTEGQPISWSSGGESVYYFSDGKLWRMDLAKRQKEQILLEEKPLAFSPTRTAAVVKKHDQLFTEDLNAPGSAVGLAIVSTRRSATDPSIQLDLSSVRWQRNGQHILLVYESNLLERIEVRQIDAIKN